MRIGRTVLDTDNMTIEDLTALINDLRKIRARKETAQALIERMNGVISEAKEHGFTFIDNSCGFVREPNDFVLHDEKA